MALKNTRTGREFSDEIKDSLRQFGMLVDKSLPEKVAVELEKVISESFDHEQYQDKQSSYGRFDKWKKRKEEDPGRKLLIGKGSGKLRRSIEVTHNKNEVKASTDIVYAPIHNEGLKAGKGKGFWMPR